jgi:hypothetical protein
MWIITGDSRDTRLNIGRSGLPCIHGKGDHNVLVSYGEDSKEEYRTLISRVRAAECSWAVMLTDDDLHPLAGPQWRKLIEISRKDSMKTHGMILYMAGSDSHEKVADHIQFAVIPPKSTFAHIYRLFELVLSENLRYQIEITFPGFHIDSINANAISWKEFCAERPYYFSEVSFSAARQRDI